MHLSSLPTPADDSAQQWDGITPQSRRGGPSRSITDVLVELGFVEASRMGTAVDHARSLGVDTAKILLEQGVISEDQLARATAERHGLDHLDLTAFQVDMAATNLLGAAAAKRYEAVPVAYVDERTLLVAMADPANVLAIDDIAIMTRSEEHTSELQSRQYLVCRLLLEKKKNKNYT